MRCGGATQLVLLHRGEGRVGVPSTLNGDERLRNGRMELRADVGLDLGQRLLQAQPRAVRAVRAHRVERVRDDQEVRRQRELLGRKPVVTRAVEALVVVLDGARLCRRELEAAQNPCREARGSAHRAPLVGRQPLTLAQHGRVDRDLAEVVQARRPAEAVDVAERKAERTGELVDVGGYADGVAVG